MIKKADLAYWLWLSSVKGVGPVKARCLLKHYQTPERLYRVESRELSVFMNQESVFNQADYRNLIASRPTFSQYQAKVQQLNENQIEVITFSDPDYPEELKEIYDAPLLLYVTGRRWPWSTALAIVGSRQCTAYGRQMAHFFASRCAEQGICIVSGLARGIDRAAHEGALAVGGKTLAVVGHGLAYAYPKENRELYRQIRKQGLILSEESYETKPHPSLFPKRNRLISGLCQAVMVIEAGERSGSLITSDFALEQGRDVFAIPGRLTDELSRGTNQLIKNGAKLITNVDDLLEELKVNYQITKEKPKKNRLKLEGNEKIVYSCISVDPVFAEKILEQTGLDIGSLQLTLFQLELKGLIEQIGNGYYVRKTITL